MIIKTKTRGLIDIPEDEARDHDGYGLEHYCTNGQVHAYFAGWRDKVAVPDIRSPRGKNQRRLYGLLKDKPTFGDLIAFLLEEDPKIDAKYAAWTVWNMVNNRMLWKA